MSAIDFVPYVVLFVGFGLSFLFYARFGLRTPGVIAAPLLAIYAMHEPLILALVLGVGILLILAAEVLQRRLLYGRRLFMALCAASVVLMSPLVLFLGFQAAAFTSVIPAIIAYNYALNNQRVLPATLVLVGEVGGLIGLGLGLTLALNGGVL